MQSGVALGDLTRPRLGFFVTLSTAAFRCGLCCAAPDAAPKNMPASLIAVNHCDCEKGSVEQSTPLGHSIVEPRASIDARCKPSFIVY